MLDQEEELLNSLLVDPSAESIVRSKIAHEPI